MPFNDARLNEYQAFEKLFEHLTKAEEAIHTIGQIREDRRWAQVGANVHKVRDLCYQLAGKGWTKQ